MTENNYDKLFELFPEVSVQAWDSAVNNELKGADFDKKLVWNTNDGFKVLPCYHDSEVSNFFPEQMIPAEFPYIRGTKTTNDWKVCQDITVTDCKDAAEIALSAIKTGADAVHFIITEKVTKSELKDLVKNIKSETFIYFTASSNEEIIAEIFAENKNLKGSINYDPLGFLTINGNFQNSEKDFVKTFKNISKVLEGRKTDIRTLNISGNNFHNCGASVVQEVGLSLSMAVEYLNQLTEFGYKPDDIFNTLKFTYSVGNNYFFEIAKLRAARYLWSKIASSYNIQNSEDCKMQIHSETSLWNMTKYDPHVNMLRATTEAMSAIIGGCDSLSIKAFDITHNLRNDFSDRIARNTQIVLKHESSLNKVTDAAAGSYYIENLTNSIIEQAWNLFLQIEETGGYLKSFEKGIIQKIISETSAKRDLDIALKNEKILGTNLYPNTLETLSENDKTPADNLKSTEYTPLKAYRGAEAFEALRIKTEKAKKTPEVFLLTIGNPAMRKARASFSAGFFSCAGFKITDNAGFTSIDDGVAAAKSSKAEITVICSSDDEYTEFVPQILEKLKDSTILVLAGYPKDHIDEYQKLGLKNFIHVKSNILETLKDFQKQLKM